MKAQMEKDAFVLFLEGRIDSGNAESWEKELFSALSQNDGRPVALDASRLEYISSAGLRVLMKIRKSAGKPVAIRDASPEVYETLDVTGFTNLFEVRKRMREVSVEGLPFIGAGANGSVYRFNRDTIIKVYNPLTNPLEKIFREKETARQAFIHDIPSAISFDVVRVGERYGILYEMVDAVTLGAAIREEPERLREYALRMAGMLKKLHATAFDEGVLPDARTNAQVWVDVAEKSGYYKGETIAKLRKLIDGIPPRNTFIHGDFHPANIMVKGDEWLLIDMGDASVGHPVVDLLATYHLMNLVSQRENGAMMYLGISQEQAQALWGAFIRAYFGTEDDKAIGEIEELLEYYAFIRGLAGVTFSKVVPDAMRKRVAENAEEFFLAAYDKRGERAAESLPV